MQIVTPLTVSKMEPLGYVLPVAGNGQVPAANGMLYTVTNSL